MRDNELNLKDLMVETVLDNFGEIDSFKLVKDTNHCGISIDEHYSIPFSNLPKYLIDTSCFDK